MRVWGLCYWLAPSSMIWNTDMIVTYMIPVLPYRFLIKVILDGNYTYAIRIENLKEAIT